MEPELRKTYVNSISQNVRGLPPPDKTSELNFDTAMYPHGYKNLHGKPR
jgi:hypothetical protein